MNKKIKVGNVDININTSAYFLIIYEQLTGSDLITDFEKIKNEKFSYKQLLDMLFSFSYNYDNNLDYKEFFQSIPLSEIMNEAFVTKLNNLIAEVFISNNNINEKKVVNQNLNKNWTNTFICLIKECGYLVSDLKLFTLKQFLNIIALHSERYQDVNNFSKKPTQEKINKIFFGG